MVAVATILLTICGIVIAVCIYGIYLGKKQEKEKIRKEREEREQFEKIVKKYMKEYESYSKEQIEKELKILNQKAISTQLARSQANIQAMKTGNYTNAPTPIVESLGDPKTEALQKLLKEK